MFIRDIHTPWCISVKFINLTLIPRHSILFVMVPNLTCKSDLVSWPVNNIYTWKCLLQSEQSCAEKHAIFYGSCCCVNCKYKYMAIKENILRAANRAAHYSHLPPPPRPQSERWRGPEIYYTSTGCKMIRYEEPNELAFTYIGSLGGVVWMSEQNECISTFVIRLCVIHEFGGCIIRTSKCKNRCVYLRSVKSFLFLLFLLN